MIKTISNIKNQILKIFKKINSAFIKIVLFFFYFAVIGFAAVIDKLSRKKNEESDSYWKNPPETKPDLEYFRSPY